MVHYPKITLKPGKEQSVLRRHPWIFSGAVLNGDNGLEDGDVVEVFSSTGQYLATGHCQQGSIMVRVLSYKQVKIDEAFWVSKLQSALKYRQLIGITSNPATNAYRLVNAEGDGLPGLVIDVYNGTAVLQPHSEGMAAAKEEIAAALVTVLGSSLKAVYCKKPDRGEGEEDKYLYGSGADNEVVENGHKFYVNWEEGQKTGFFLDQRDNRSLLAKYSEGRTVLNAFCYSGGFSVYALLAGAKEVWSVDSSKRAIDWTERNVALNPNYTGTHHAEASDVQDFLKKEGPQFDLMVLDPPAYAKHLSARHKAVQGYRRLNAMGISKLKPNSILFTFSCSQAVDADLFYNTIVAAAIEAGRNIRVMHKLTQPADHAVSIYHPEGAYLKGLVLFVE